MSAPKLDPQAIGSAAVRQLSGDDELAKKTLRTVALLVGAWAVFIGALSLVAVLVTSKAVSRSSAADESAAKSDTKAPKHLSL